MESAHSCDKLKSIFDGLQSRLEGELKGHRQAINHPSSQGEAAEEEWINLLQAHLPNRYQADRAFVIDAHGGCSQQIDVVIYDRQYSPLLYNQSKQLYVPAESVYAVLEVKQSLTAEHLRYAADKAVSVRQLTRSTGEVHHIQGRSDSECKPILAGILCYESGWTPPFGKPFQNHLSDLSGIHQLNIGCSLRHGTFEVPYPGKATGYPDLSASAAIIIQDRWPLLQFLLRLLKQLQPLGTAPAINYEAYLSRLSMESNGAD
jgi:hypothetical protein